jgi:hypothetical protein
MLLITAYRHDRYLVAWQGGEVSHDTDMAIMRIGGVSRT